MPHLTVRPILRLNVIATLFLAAALAVTAAEKSPPPPAIPDAELILLPKYEIKAERILPPMKQWKYVSIPGYEILSDASDRNTEKFVEDFMALQNVVEILLKDSSRPTALPTYLVLCSKGSNYDHFLPPEQISRAGSVNLNDAERSAIVVDFTYGDTLGRDTFGYVDPFRTFYQSYFNYILAKRLPPTTPLWFKQGMQRLFADVKFMDQWIVVGEIEGPTLPNTVRSQTGQINVPDRTSVRPLNQNAWSSGATFGALAHSAPIPFSDFFRPNYTPTTDEEARTYSIQTYAFVHMCLFGRGQRYQKPLYKLLLKASTGTVDEAVFQECFGMNYAKMARELSGYVTTTDYQKQMLKLKNGHLFGGPNFKLREATDSESGRIAGEVMRLAGRRDESLNRLVAPYLRGGRDPELIAALGLAEAEAGHKERARKFLELAAKYQTKRTRAWVALARLRLDEAETKAKAENRPLAPAEIATVQEALFVSTALPPPMFDLYDALAKLWFENETKPSPEDFKKLAEGAIHYGHRLGLVYRIAAIAVRSGYHEKARALIAHGLENVQDAASQAEFKELLAQLPASTLPPPPDRQLPATAPALKPAVKPSETPQNNPAPARPAFSTPPPEDNILPKTKEWRLASLPGYEVLSELPDEETIRFIREFYLVNQVADVILPATEKFNARPKCFVLCREQKSLEKFLQKEANNNKGSNTTSFFKADAKTICVADLRKFRPAPNGRTYPVTPYAGFYSNYFQSLLRQEFQGSQPSWMSEGLYLVYQRVRFSETEIVLGYNDEDAPSTPLAMVTPPKMPTYAETFASEGEIVSLKEYFDLKKTSGVKAATRDAQRSEALKISKFRPQSNLFAHYCLLTENPKYKNAYLELARRADEGRITEQIFQECFGIGFAEMEKALLEHAKAKNPTTVSFTPKNGRLVQAPSIELRDATDEEVKRISDQVAAVRKNKL